MANRGRPRAKYKFKNFEKTYRRYKRDYYRAARKKWNKLHGKKANARLPSYVNKRALENTMYDKPLTRTQLRLDYRTYKKELIEEDKTTDPIRQIISDQTYELSYKQYKSFRKAVRSEEFKVFAANNEKLKNLDKVTEFEFRTEMWKNKDYFDAIKAYYHEMKREAEEMGLSGKEAWLYAQDETHDLFWGDSK